MDGALALERTGIERPHFARSALERPAFRVVTSPTSTLTRAPAGAPTAAKLAHGGPGSDPVTIEPYRAAWPGQFRVEAEVLRTALAALAPRIEHIGSTAVHGLPAQPVVDLLVGLRDSTEIDAHATRLRNFGYLLAPAARDGADPRRFLIRTVRGVRTHHVHVVKAFGDAWHRLLLFRDLLRIDGQLAVEYAELKRTLAMQHRVNRVAYTAGKTAFIQAVLGVQPA